MKGTRSFHDPSRINKVPGSKITKSVGGDAKYFKTKEHFSKGSRKCYCDQPSPVSTGRARRQFSMRAKCRGLGACIINSEMNIRSDKKRKGETTTLPHSLFLLLRKDYRELISAFVFVFFIFPSGRLERNARTENARRLEGSKRHRAMTAGTNFPLSPRLRGSLRFLFGELCFRK